MLKAQGFRTGVVGKLHVQPADVYPWDYERTANFGNRDVWDMGRKVREFLQQADGRPFYLHIGFSDPHRAGGPGGFANHRDYPHVQAREYSPADVETPDFLPDRPEVRAELAQYYQSIDRARPRLRLCLDALQEAGRLEDTLVLCFSDHGMPFPGAKASPYDSGLHVPFLAMAPGQRRKGHANDAMISLTDVAPTVIDWCGAQVPENYRFHGRSIVPLLEREGAEGRDEHFYSHTFHEIVNFFPWRGVRTRKYKYTKFLYPELEMPLPSDLWGSPTWQGGSFRRSKTVGLRRTRRTCCAMRRKNSTTSRPTRWRRRILPDRAGIRGRWPNCAKGSAVSRGDGRSVAALLQAHRVAAGTVIKPPTARPRRLYNPGMTHRVRIAACSLLLLLAWVAVRPAAPPAAAADADATAWGATDPTWSPDGKRLAFSLFGSIWTVAAAGGAAEQLTTSAGFHDHPAWSPDGASIAYVSGANPRGRFAKISGKLAVVDAASGRERIVPLPYPTGGAPDWAADGKSILCPLLVGGAGALLHAVDLASGRSAPLQSRPQRNPAGPWLEVSSGPEEIFFAARRVGSPQVWSLPAGRDGLTIQLPLTRYLPQHIVMLDGVSALPAGGAVFSADVINGAGNFDLYRVSSQGGEPAALTDTPRHELAPEVSPDGSRIAFASNRLGNIDLFTMPAAGGEAAHLLIDALKFRKPAGRARVRIVDEMGKPDGGAALCRGIRRQGLRAPRRADFLLPRSSPEAAAMPFSSR